MKQLSFAIKKESMIAGRQDGQFDYAPVHVSKSTFKSGLASKVHRWFRLTPSFGPDLVQLMLEQLDCSSDDVVLDPFSGAATTLIECKTNGIESFGFEINPVLHFVGSTCLQWELDHSELMCGLSHIISAFKSNAKPSNLAELADFGLCIPPIHNANRWWRDDVLIDLLHLKKCIDQATTDFSRNFFRLALAGVLVPDLTNVTLGRLQLHFIDKSKHEMDVLKSFGQHALQMIDDVEELEQAHLKVKSNVYHQNSVDLSELKLRRKASVVITSPPYPNRYSYVWNTRPHLYMLDFIDTGKQAADIDKKTIGGTWGTATSELQKGVIQPASDNVAHAVRQIIKPLRDADQLMSNYVVHYFNRLEKQILEMNLVTSPQTRAAYVVGNSEIKGVYIPTDSILADIFEGAGQGYKVDRIHRFRKRNSGVDLYESIVYAKR